MNIELLPWAVPNFVRVKMPPRKRQDGWQEPPSWPLSSVDAETLAKQCDDFRAEVFRKAEKTDPAKTGR